MGEEEQGDIIRYYPQLRQNPLGKGIIPQGIAPQNTLDGVFPQVNQRKDAKNHQY
ncbi:MAG: hypothetical protein U5L07_10815 [Desulfobacterales bacterium]|nr:hypothetical protein [Desulfobacterales bacterium]